MLQEDGCRTINLAVLPFPVRITRKKDLFDWLPLLVLHLLLWSEVLIDSPLLAERCDCVSESCSQVWSSLGVVSCVGIITA